MFIQHHIGTLPVVEPDGKLVGTLTIRDLFAQVQPDFVNMMQNIDFVLDFGAAETRQPVGSAGVDHNCVINVPG